MSLSSLASKHGFCTVARVSLECAEPLSFDEVFNTGANIFDKSLRILAKKTSDAILRQFPHDATLMGDVGHRWPDEELINRVGLHFAHKPLHFVSFPTSIDEQNHSLIVTDKIFDGKNYSKLDAIVSNLVHFDPRLAEIYRNSRRQKDPSWEPDVP